MQRVADIALFFGRVALILRTKPSRLQRQRRRANARRNSMRKALDRNLERLVRIVKDCRDERGNGCEKYTNAGTRKRYRECCSVNMRPHEKHMPN